MEAHGIELECAQLYLPLFDPIECILPSSSICEIIQSGILEWADIPPLGNLPNSGTEPVSPKAPALAGGFFTIEPPGKPRWNFPVTILSLRFSGTKYIHTVV